MTGRTYRYYRGTPLYPFGYGLTYGDCFVSALAADGELAQVTVRNVGAVATEDVVELYLRDEKSHFAPPNPVLCGFKRISLAAGEEKTVSVPLDPLAFTVVNDAGVRLPGSGSWTLFAGCGGPDGRTAELTGRGPCSVKIGV